eukprot:gene14250-19123_t
MLRDYLGDRVTDELLSEVHTIYGYFHSLFYKELKPWSEFFSVFKTPPTNARQLEQRITTNLLHYYANYLPRSVTSKSNELYEELKLNGFNWFMINSNEMKSKDAMDPEDPYSATTSKDDNASMAQSLYGKDGGSVRKRPPPAGK